MLECMPDSVACSDGMETATTCASAYKTVYSKYGPTPPTWSSDQYARVPPCLYQPAREDRQRRVHEHGHLRQPDLVETDASRRAGPPLIFELLFAASDVRVPVPNSADEVVQHGASKRSLTYVLK